MGKIPQISIIIPAYNEAGNIKPLTQDIEAQCSSLDYEILLVDDGSTDSTLSEMKECVDKNPSIRILQLRRNFGQTAAMAAGFDHAQAEILIPMDGDGQNDPKDISKLIQKFNEGYDVVSGWRRDRQDSFFSRKLPSRIANFLISFVTGVHLHDYGCTLKVYRRSIINNLQLSGEMHRFLPAWCVWLGGKVAELPVNHRPRTRGQSKYGICRIFKVIIDLFTLKFFSSYLVKPNYLFSGSGIVSLGLSFLSFLVALIDKLGPDQIPKLRLPLLVLAVFFAIVSFFLFLMGVLSELLVRLYFEVRKQKPYSLQ